MIVTATQLTLTTTKSLLNTTKSLMISLAQIKATGILFNCCFLSKVLDNVHMNMMNCVKFKSIYYVN